MFATSALHYGERCYDLTFPSWILEGGGGRGEITLTPHVGFSEQF